MPPLIYTLTDLSAAEVELIIMNRAEGAWIKKTPSATSPPYQNSMEYCNARAALRDILNNAPP